MKVKLLKDFHEHKAGDTVEVGDERARYWERVGVARPVKEKKEVEATTEKKEVKTETEKKEVAPVKTEKKAATKHTAKKRK